MILSISSAARPWPLGGNFVNRPAAIGSGDGIDPFAGIVGKILLGKSAAVPAGCLHDGLGHLAFVIGVAAAMSDQSQ